MALGYAIFDFMISFPSPSFASDRIERISSTSFWFFPETAVITRFDFFASLACLLLGQQFLHPSNNFGRLTNNILSQRLE